MGLAPIEPGELLREVARRFNLPREVLVSRGRNRVVVRARFAACWVLHKRPKLNLDFRSNPEIGRIVGLRDHTSVIHAVRRAGQIAAREPDYAATLARLAGLPSALRGGAGEAARMMQARRECSQREAAEAAVARSVTRFGEGVADDDRDARARAAGSVALLAAIVAARGARAGA